jgi:flagellar biosynthetic protein FliR
VAWLLTRHLGDLALFWLVVARAAGLVAAAPVVSSPAVPAPVRAGLSVLLAVAAFPAARLGARAAAEAPAAYAAALAGEVAVGALIGFVARLVFAAAEVAGGILDLQMGFTLAGLLDPVYGQPTSVLGTLFAWLATVLFLLGGGLELLALALAGSYAHLAAGAAADWGAGAGLALQALGWAFVTGIELAAPLLAVGLAVNLVLGLVGRVVPQLGVLQAALPAQILVGLAVLVLALPLSVAVLGQLGARAAGWIGGLWP